MSNVILQAECRDDPDEEDRVDDVEEEEKDWEEYDEYLEEPEFRDVSPNLENLQESGTYSSLYFI